MAEQSPSFQFFPFGNDGPFTRFQGHSSSGTQRGLISLFQGDFFQMGTAGTSGTARGFDAVWDRGSLVAIDPTLRLRYRETIGRTLRPGGVMLLCAMDRRKGTPDGRSGGPPYSLSSTDVRWLFEDADWVESVMVLDEKDLMQAGEGKRWRSFGLEEMYEVVILIKKKS